MSPRLFIDHPLPPPGTTFALPAGPARHVQVLRLQPGAALTLFDGRGGEHAASVVQMGRSEVTVLLGAHAAVDRELALPVTLALGMPANERMDTVIEKATELGAAAVQPLLCERSVLRLTGERAQKRHAHWQGVALAASEQSGRTRVLQVAPVCSLGARVLRADTAPLALLAHLSIAASIDIA
jgi:16S rRNA (uracil1498-N3)-methyltransferase